MSEQLKPEVVNHIFYSDAAQEILAKEIDDFNRYRAGCKSGEPMIELYQWLIVRMIQGKPSTRPSVREGEKLREEAKGMLTARGYWRDEYEANPIAAIIAEFGAVEMGLNKSKSATSPLAEVEREIDWSVAIEEARQFANMRQEKTCEAKEVWGWHNQFTAYLRVSFALLRARKEKT